jgi:transcriptional regulator with XRE-family HTH domain
MTHRPLDVTLGQILRQARQAAGFSIRELEALTGVGRMTISRLETDAHVTPPTAQDLSRLGQALELDEVQLFALAGVPAPRQLTSLDAMLRTEYGLPPAAITEARQQLQAIIEKYDHGG